MVIYLVFRQNNLLVYGLLVKKFQNVPFIFSLAEGYHVLDTLNVSVISIEIDHF